MKKITILAMMMTIAISANAMSFSQAKSEALFLSDKMAYELNLTSAQYDDVYEINLDYMMSVDGRNDAYGSAWSRRNTELKYVLTVWQYNKYKGMSYFYRPITWKNGGWNFNIYSRYNNRNHYYNNQPKTYASYRGGGHVTRGNGHNATQNSHNPTHNSQPDHKGNNQGHGGIQPNSKSGPTVHRGFRG